MKRNNLTTAVIAGLAGVAGFAGVSNAVQLSADGLGQVLTYSYYTVNANQQTNFSVVNTTGQAKAVKVRFLEAYNSREVLDFNLFLSPWDVWTAAITEVDNGGAIFTADTSCTAPYLYGGGTGAADGVLPNGLNYKAFVTDAFNGTKVDGGPTGISRTREGHFEMIEMASIPASSPVAAWVTHDSGAFNCSKVRNLGTASPEVEGFGPPTGGLFGNAAVVNVGDGTMFSYTADAIDGFRTERFFTDSGNLEPSLADAETAPGMATAHVFMPGGQLVTASYVGSSADRVDAVSAVFAAQNVFNEWSAEAGIGGASEWIVSFPTKRFYVDDQIVGGTAEAPFSEVFDGQSCDRVGITIYNREEVPLTPAGCGWSPCPETEESSLCFETQVITFNQGGAGASDVLGSALSLNIDASQIGDSGWLNLRFPDAIMRPDMDGKQFHGLPVTGHLAQRVINVNAQDGLLASYGGMFRHRVARTCTVGEGTGAIACS